MVHHFMGKIDEFGNVDIAFDVKSVSEAQPSVVAGQIEHGLTQGLGGNGARIHHRAADHIAPFDDAGLFSQFGGLDGAVLTCRAAADNGAIKVTHGNLSQKNLSQSSIAFSVHRRCYIIGSRREFDSAASMASELNR